MSPWSVDSPALSSWWAEPLDGVLSPLGVSLCRSGRSPAREQCLVLDRPQDLTDHGPALAGLRQLLTARGRRGARLKLGLSGHFVRFARVPDAPGLRGAEEHLAHARHCLQQAYGGLAQDLVPAVSTPVPAGGALVAGIRRSLLEGLRDLAREARVQLAQVEPVFALACNRYRARLLGDAFWLAVLEPGRVGLGLNREGAWLALHNQTLDGRDSDGLADLLERAALSEDFAAAPVPVYLVGATAEEAQRLHARVWRPQILTEGRAWLGLRQEPQS